MKIFLRILAVVMVLIGLFLDYAVVHAIASAGGARVPVCIGYVVGSIVLYALATLAWRGRGRGRGVATA